VPIVFLLLPLITGKTVFGVNSTFSANSTYLLNDNSERQIANKLSSSDFVLLIPGAGNFDHPSGRIGPVDPMPYYIDHFISFDAVVNDTHSPYATYLTLKTPEIPPEINAVVYRKSFHKFRHYDWASAGFTIVYEDEYSVLYKRDSQPKIPTYSNHHLLYIVSACMFLYASLIYFMFKYAASTRKL
jgi:hypothetical protein